MGTERFNIAKTKNARRYVKYMKIKRQKRMGKEKSNGIWKISKLNEWKK